MKKEGRAVRSNEHLAQRIREACKHPMALAVGIASRSRKEAAALAHTLQLTDDEEYHAETIAIAKRDAEKIFGTDFLTALKQTLEKHREGEKAVSAKRKEPMSQWLTYFCSLLTIELLRASTTEQASQSPSEAIRVSAMVENCIEQAFHKALINKGRLVDDLDQLQNRQLFCDCPPSSLK